MTVWDQLTERFEIQLSVRNMLKVWPILKIHLLDNRKHNNSVLYTSGGQVYKDILAFYIVVLHCILNVSFIKIIIHKLADSTKKIFRLSL